MKLELKSEQNITLLHNRLKKKKLFIHIGFPKTGTTTVQEHLLGKHSEIHCIGQPFTKTATPQRHLTWMITRADELTFVSQLDDFINQTIIPLVETDKEILTLSEESFSVGSAAQGKPNIDRVAIARRLRLLFPNAQIIITLRRQSDLLYSAYGQELKMSTLPPPGFNLWLQTLWNERWYGTLITALRYNEIVQLYEDLFGKDFLKLFLFEELKTNQDEYISKWCKILGVNDLEQALSLTRYKWENNSKASTVRRQQLKKRFLQFCVFMSNPSQITNLIQRKCVKHTENMLMDYYIEGNKTIQKNYNLNLEKYNYFQ